MKWCRAELALYLVITILGIASMLSACGQKGSLYLPQEKSETQQKQ